MPAGSSAGAHAGFALDAPGKALQDRQLLRGSGLVHHSDRGSQYVSIRYTERTAEAGIEPFVGSVERPLRRRLGRDDQASTRVMPGAWRLRSLYKAEVIHRRGPWRSFEAAEYATLERVDWFNHRRLLEPIGNVPPAEAEDQFHAAADIVDMAA